MEDPVAVANSEIGTSPIQEALVLHFKNSFQAAKQTNRLAGHTWDGISLGSEFDDWLRFARSECAFG